MKRNTIEFLWAWFDALRRRDTATMAAALHRDVIGQGVRENLVCHGPREVIDAFLAGYDANQEIDSLELFGSDRRIVLGVRSPGLGEIADGAVDDKIYNVFTIDHAKITRIEDYRDRDQALAAVAVADR
jgi:hypothetical protein